MVVEPGMAGATGNIYCGLHEFEDMALLLHLLTVNDRFVDIGANIGSYTILAACICKSKVISLEPVPKTFDKLQRNIRVNKIENLTNAMQCAAGERLATAMFTSDLDTTNRMASESYTGEVIEVPVRTLDELLIDFPAVMWKVDVEGFEEQVLRGAGKVLRHPELRVVLLEGSSQEISSTMEAAGFDRAIYDPWRRSFSPSSERNASNNNLWIRDLAEVAERCKQAPQFKILGMRI